jgi:hypothetical protein
MHTDESLIRYFFCLKEGIRRLEKVKRSLDHRDWIGGHNTAGFGFTSPHMHILRRIWRTEQDG